jgi:hypothetical protein
MTDDKKPKWEKGHSDDPYDIVTANLQAFIAYPNLI